VVAASIVPVMGVLYALGALSVAASNADQIVPSFAAVFSNAFTGSAATGGFLGATFAYAFNRGVNRGLFSNEAGQGSAPIAHASARTEEPVSEGMVSILEPFIDTLLICTLTGLVILSAGVPTEKFDTQFAPFDTEFVAGTYKEGNPAHVKALFDHLDIVPPANDPVTAFSGSVLVSDGVASSAAFTVLHNRSIAEDVRFQSAGRPFSGVLEVVDGSLVTPDVDIRGRSLLHSVPLTAEAFKRSFLGEYGQYAVTVGLVMFAFSTALAWSYYGDRAVTYLFGVQWVSVYRMVYVAGFFAATVVDTSLVWLISAVTLALMTIPNLIGLVLMRREVKSLTDDYWRRVSQR
jgi:AGCS family alanine or glycine:cation symporter